MTHPFPTRRSSDLARAPGYRDRRPRCRSRAAGSAGREEDRVPQALVDHGGAHRPAFLHRADEASRTRRATERLAVGRGYTPDARRSHTRAGPLRHSHQRSEEHTSELQSLMRNSYAVFCLKKKKENKNLNNVMKGMQTKNLPT